MWPGATIVIIGTGPSLTQEDVSYCHGRAKVIAIKDAIQMAPCAECLYSCGGDAGRWWQRNGDSLNDYEGLRYTLDPAAEKWAGVLENTGFIGLETYPNGLRTGHNSGYQAIGLAVHLGAAKIILVGYDLMPSADGKDHFFGAHWHKATPPFDRFRPLFDTLVEPLKALDIQIINATRRTALTCFPQMSIQEALA